ITLLHSCSRPSMLRFRMSAPSAKLLNVKEADEAGRKKLPSNPATAGRLDGGGMATAPVCSERPKALLFL
ncbi:MAG: hypothetical protein ACRDI3_07950, partial [Actinomycetota bacterium]